MEVVMDYTKYSDKELEEALEELPGLLRGAFSVRDKKLVVAFGEATQSIREELARRENDSK
jgi:hypothetical protein